MLKGRCGTSDNVRVGLRDDSKDEARVTADQFMQAKAARRNLSRYWPSSRHFKRPTQSPGTEENPTCYSMCAELSTIVRGDGDIRG